MRYRIKDTKNPRVSDQANSDESKPVDGHAAPKDIYASLLQSGGEPRSMLRLTPVVGSGQDTTFTHLTRTWHGQEQKGDGTTSTLELQVVTQLEQIDAAGLTTYGFNLNTVSTRQSGAGSAARSIVATHTKDVHGHWTFDHHNVIQVFALSERPKGAEFHQVRRAAFEGWMSAMPTILPVEAVGIGGCWRVTKTVHTHGVEVVQHTDFSLIKRSGSKLELEFTIEQASRIAETESAPISGFALATSYNGSGTGTATIHLAELMPLSMSMEIRSVETNTVVHDGGRPDSERVIRVVSVTGGPTSRTS